MADSHERAGDGDEGAERPVGPALRRGFARRCPNCGEGALLHSYLKINDSCPACGEDLHHARADDGPAYLTILIVGHVMAPVLLWVYPAFRPDPLPLAIGFSIATVALSLWLLPRLKGLIVGVQWAKRMGGFGA